MLVVVNLLINIKLLNHLEVIVHKIVQLNLFINIHKEQFVYKIVKENMQILSQEMFVIKPVNIELIQMVLKYVWKIVQVRRHIM